MQKATLGPLYSTIFISRYVSCRGIIRNFNTSILFYAEQDTISISPSPPKRVYVPSSISKDVNFGAVFIQIENMLNELPTNNETQILIEKYLRDQFVDLFEERKNKKSYVLNSLSSKFRDFLYKAVDDIDNSINKLRRQYSYDNLTVIYNKDFSLLSERKKQQLLLKDIFDVIIHNKIIIGKLIHTLFVIIQNQNSETLETHNSTTNTTHANLRLGKEIVNAYLYILFKSKQDRVDSDGNNLFKSFPEFKLNLMKEGGKLEYIQEESCFF